MGGVCRRFYRCFHSPSQDGNGGKGGTFLLITFPSRRVVPATVGRGLALALHLPCLAPGLL